MKTPKEIEDARKAEVREVREHTNRIRSALRDLPRVTREEGWNLDSDKDNLREVLQEIVGSAVHIADLLGVEL